jgi:PAS domain-containing protein
MDQEAVTQAIDAVSELLLVADEELRVQDDQLRQLSRRLGLLAAEHEELFTNAPIAYLQTDADGLILRYNWAAHRLLDLPADPRAKHTLTGRLTLDNRQALRTLISRLRQRRSKTPLGSVPQAVEVELSRPDGRTIPVVITGWASRPNSSGRPVLHFELRERPNPEAVGEPTAVRPALTERPQAIATIAAAAAEFAVQEGLAATLEQIARQALTAVPASDEAGVTLLRAGRMTETPARTGELAAACERLQCELGEGPCFDAVNDARVIQVRDVANDRRWPRFAAHAARLGVGSILAAPLVTPREVVGALNLYARGVGLFDAEDEVVSAAFALHAGIAMSHAELEAGLRSGLATREEIGRAVGILMERHRVTAAQGFDLLVRASQHSHRKVRDIAAWMNDTGEDPSTLLPS